MKASPLLARASLVAVSVSALIATPALWREVAPTSVEIVAVRPLVADWCEEGTHIEVDVRVRLARRVRDWRNEEEGSWLEVERRGPDGWEQQALWVCSLSSGRQRRHLLPAGTEWVWTEWVDLRREGEREMRFVLDVESPTWCGLSSEREFAASEPFRPSELLARYEESVNGRSMRD